MDSKQLYTVALFFALGYVTGAIVGKLVCFVMYLRDRKNR